MAYHPGGKVVFVDGKAHEREPEFYPEPGTVGEIIRVSRHGLNVRWPKGSTSWDDVWGCSFSRVEPYKPEPETEAELTKLEDADTQPISPHERKIES